MNKLPIIRKPIWVKNPANKPVSDTKKVRRKYKYIKNLSTYLKLNPMCVCGCNRLSTEVDHIIQLSVKGHPNDERNLNAMCTECHEIKSFLERYFKIYDKIKVGCFYVPYNKQYYVDMIVEYKESELKDLKKFIKRMLIRGRGE